MMIVALWSLTAMLVMTTLASDVPIRDANDYDYEALINELPDILPYIANREYSEPKRTEWVDFFARKCNVALALENLLRYMKKLHSLVDDYRGEKNGRTVIETNALINTKYRTWKRNADLINSLLALPKGMNDAGRR